MWCDMNDSNIGLGVATIFALLSVVVAFGGTAYVTYGTVLPLVPATGWAWLIAGIVAVVAGYIAANILWFVIVALVGGAAVALG